MYSCMCNSVSIAQMVHFPAYLFDRDADPNRVDGSFNQHLLLLVATDDQRSQQEFLVAPHLYLGLVVTLDHLRLKVLQAHGSREAGTHSIEVWF